MTSTAEIMAELASRDRFNRLFFYDPYDWQREFHNAGADKPHRLLLAAGGVGKSECGGFETAVHLTGLYPDWWRGKRFDRPVMAWVGSTSNVGQKDYTQPKLLGSDLNDPAKGGNLGTGMVPRRCIVGKPKLRQCGIADVADTTYIRHEPSGSTSVLHWKTMEQGWRAWQGAAPDLIWIDEQPEESAANEKRVFTEATTRIFRSDGILYSTLTPLLGESPMIRYFTDPDNSYAYVVKATWDDAPHLTEEAKAAARASYPAHERQAREWGIPMMGEGAVFPIEPADITVEPFEVPPHFTRICGIDFGWDHPTAACWLAYDRGSDVLYIVDEYRKAKTDPVHHAHAIKQRGAWIPVAWPHDGMNRDPKGGKNLRDIYRKEHGVNMLSMSARYDNDKGGSQEVWPIVTEFQQRMETGRLKVFSTCQMWLGEMRSYHTRVGQSGKPQLVAVRDDLLKAGFYAAMMKRFAVPATSGRIRRETYSRPVVGM